MSYLRELIYYILTSIAINFSLTLFYFATTAQQSFAIFGEPLLNQQWISMLFLAPAYLFMRKDVLFSNDQKDLEEEFKRHDDNKPIQIVVDKMKPIVEVTPHQGVSYRSRTTNPASTDNTIKEDPTYKGRKLSI